MKFRIFPILGVILLISSVLMLFALWKHQREQVLFRERNALLNDGLKKIQKIPIDEIKKADLQPLFDSFQTVSPNPGMAIGIVFGTRVFPFYFGVANTAGKPITSETIFEAASVTKTYTALLLAKTAWTHQIPLDQPVEKLLGFPLPNSQGKPISLLQLATHTSGLPRLPHDFTPREMRQSDPYAGYSVERLFQSLKTHPPLESNAYQYSNQGIALLGHALAKKQGTSWEKMLQTEILNPLELKETWVELPAEVRSRKAQPFSRGKPASEWTTGAFAPAGGIQVTLPDLLKYLQHMTYADRTPFPDAIRETMKPRFRATPSMEIALAWHLTTYRDGKILWHNGESGGFHSFVAFWQDIPLGVAILTNSTDDWVDVMGIRLLQSMRQL